MIEDKLEIGKKIMLNCEVSEEYKGNCIIKVRLPNEREFYFHLNAFITKTPYTSWEN